MLDFIARQTPAAAFVQFDQFGLVATDASPNRFTTSGAEISFTRDDNGRLAINIHCPARPIQRVVLRWKHPTPPAATTLYLADHWERSYGDLQWQHLRPERVMPWYVLAHDPQTKQTSAVGVLVQANAMCFWTIDNVGVSLWLDVRNGSRPATLGNRQLHAATIVAASANAGENACAFARTFCKQMCPTPRLADHPVVGNNNWYYAYGENFNADTIRRDGKFLSELAGDHPNRPYCVIDAGWTHGGACPGGPWTHGIPEKFPDMPGLAADLRKIGVRPGIWIRPTALTVVDDPRRLRAGPHPAAEKPLDLTMPENLRLIHDDVKRIRSWGYELIKHDFSTFDAFAKWGLDFGAEIVAGDWNWHDQSLTNAEVLLQLYRTLRTAVGDDTILLGCNTVGHLGAGIFEVQRIGDDTSGKHWERTRKMGVNTLAFRLCQHNTFFGADADCAAHTSATPWEKDRRWLDLVARSGTPLFISVDPTTISPEKREAFKRAVRTALTGGDFTRGVEPLDWLTNTTPEHWQFGNETIRYDWTEDYGTMPIRLA